MAHSGNDKKWAGGQRERDECAQGEGLLMPHASRFKLVQQTCASADDFFRRTALARSTRELQ
jgi:hypothetical protein